MKTTLIILLLLAVVAAGLTWSFATNETWSEPYKPYRVDFDTNCVTYYKECRCLGDVLIAESYPEQYICQGEETCSEINEIVCP